MIRVISVNIHTNYRTWVCVYQEGVNFIILRGGGHCAGCVVFKPELKSADKIFDFRIFIIRFPNINIFYSLSRVTHNIRKIVFILWGLIITWFILFTLWYNFILSELKTLEWDILNTDRLIWVSNVHTFDYILNPLFWISLLYKSYVW